MKTKNRDRKSTKPARHKFAVFGQLIKLIPPGLIHSAAREHGLEGHVRGFSVLSHLASMMFLQLASLISLNDICDWMRLKAASLLSFGVTPPSRNNLSHANKTRNAAFAESLFWKTLAHLSHAAPEFQRRRPGGKSRKGHGARLHRFKAKISAVDSTTLELWANCMDWAKHRRRKAAAKMHLRLGLNSFLPEFAVVDTAKEHDNKRAREVCSGLEAGEIVIFDKAYVDFAHLRDLDKRGVKWVTRAKSNMKYRRVRKNPLTKSQKAAGIVRDETVRLTGVNFAADFKGWTFRLVEAWVEVDEEMRLMTFITNGTAWSPRSVCDLYKARWEIEVFFKQVKQTLQLSSFVGYSANALRWQVWTALLVYTLLRFMGFLSAWGHSFTRLFAVARAALWERLDLLALLKSYGTAGGSFKMLGKPPPWQPILKGMEGFFAAEERPAIPKRPRGRPRGRPAKSSQAST
jgi:hypothetical protein